MGEEPVVRTCFRRTAHWKVSGSSVILRIGKKTIRLERTRVPAVIRKTFKEMVWLSGLACAPRMEFVRSLGGFGGAYLAGLILVGVEDARELAQNIWAKHKDFLKRRMLALCGKKKSQRCQPGRLFQAAVQGRMLAHELGHAMRDFVETPTPFDNEEAAADYLAGKLDALRGEDWRRGRLIFYSIGCEGLFCTHPTPCGRAHAYVSGYEDGLGEKGRCARA